jgi:hypothetical protein
MDNQPQEQLDAKRRQLGTFAASIFLLVAAIGVIAFSLDLTPQVRKYILGGAVLAMLMATRLYSRRLGL